MPVHEIWTPAETDIVQGHASYLNYAVGLTMLTDPQKLQQVYGGRNLESDQLGVIVAHAEELMLRSLQDVVRSVHRPEIRTNLVPLEGAFDAALPRLVDLRDSVYCQHRDQLDDLNPDLAKVRPLPVTERVAYRYVCRSRTDKLATVRLLGGFMPAAIFGNRLQAKMLADDY